MAQEQKKDLQVLVQDDVKKMELLEQKDLPALEKSLKEYHVACMEVKDVGNKLGAELRKLGEIVADNEWAACLSRVGDVQHFYENVFGDCVEKVLLDSVIEPLKKYTKEESNVASEHIRKSRAAVKAFDELTQKRTTQSMAKKTTTADMLNILRAEKQEAELKTAMLNFCKTYDAQRCFKLICLVNEFMRGQLTYHEAVLQKHKELVGAWKPLTDKKLSEFDVPRDVEDRLEKKTAVEPVHNLQVATRVATSIKNLLPAQYSNALRSNPNRQSVMPSSSTTTAARQQPATISAGTGKKSDFTAVQPVKPEAAAVPSQWKSREAVRGALVALQSRLNDMSPSQISVEITRILLMLDDTYIPPAASSLSSPNLTPPAAAGAAPAAASGGGGGAPLQTTHSMQVVSTSFVPPKGHSSKRLSVGSLSEFIEEKPHAKPAPADRVNSSIDEILAGFLDTTKADNKPAAGAASPPTAAAASPQTTAPPPTNGLSRATSSNANITDELMALINQPTSPKGKP